jgi:hypothetical protein
MACTYSWNFSKKAFKDAGPTMVDFEHPIVKYTPRCYIKTFASINCCYENI